MNPVHPVSVPTQPPSAVKTEVSSGEENLASVTVSSRIPEFWVDKPRLWFVQFEATVFSQKLSDAAKQNLVVTKLSKNAIEQVSDLLLNPPADNKYTSLKDRLLQVFEESEARQFQKLLGEMELGSQKPSQLLRRMRDLARKKIPDETLKIMWSGHLPASVRAVLAVTEVSDLENLAIVADKIMETTRPIDVAEVASTSSTWQSDVVSQIATLTQEIRNMSWRSRESQRGRQQARTQSQNRGRSKSRESRSRNNPDWLCFYHFRYGKKAAKCIDPCNWEKKSKSEN
ncbi:uncharacterized protein LOC118277079 [Spodoptera frugiperda]|uniref:Uncharacterized protein LOC118277079 n=1 Tax=Spodoptera frugiperda TaxID=7108 RepID=A0A9R0DFT2_SPOFR|nr:uncharacterized protein LOC118277079 [Spodoptera frugiperda]